MVLVPDWIEASAATGGPQGRRLIVSCGVAVVPSDATEVRALSVSGGDAAARYAAAARALLALLRDLLDQPGAAPALVQLAVPAGEDGLFSGLGAMLDTAALEHPGLRAQAVEVSGDLDAETAGRLLAAEAGTDSRVRLTEGRRFVRTWHEMPRPAAPHRWRPRGVYLIVGGMGGLGRLLARDIAENHPRRGVGAGRVGAAGCGPAKRCWRRCGRPARWPPIASGRFRRRRRLGPGAPRSGGPRHADRRSSLRRNAA